MFWQCSFHNYQTFVLYHYNQVFSFLRSFSREDEIPQGAHEHCFKCRRVDCKVFADNVSACAIATCEVCSWRCHACKLAEHELTCPEARISCINKEYGCPLKVKRSKMSAHLPVCPASVVVCAEEWSRFFYFITNIYLL